MFPKSKAEPLSLWAIAGLQLVLVSAPTAAQAQAQATAPASFSPASARSDPADPMAPVPAALYASPLQAHQGFVEPQVAPWRDTNERVRQRGGWRAYAREAREPDAAQPAARGASGPAPSAKPASGGHAGHEMK